MKKLLKKKNKTKLDYTIRNIFFLSLFMLSLTLVVIYPKLQKVKSENKMFNTQIIELTRMNDTYNYLIKNSMDSEKLKEYLLSVQELNPEEVEQILLQLQYSK